MRKMRLADFQWILWLFLTVPLLAGNVTVRNLKVQQHWPWNGLVDITYSVESDIKNDDGTPADVSLTFLGYDMDQNRLVKMMTLTGDGVGQPVKAGGSYKTTWNAAQDYSTFNSSAFKVTVKAVARGRRGMQNQKAGKYLVIDLSGGPEAAAYPYRYSENGPDIAGDVCRTTELWLREIPAGTFIMGSPENELGREADETQHQVTLTKPFYMGVFEVTQKQWNLVLGDCYWADKGEDRPAGGLSYDNIRGTGLGSGWPVKGHQVDPESFIGRLQSKTGLILDLPTEAQWEYACRAGTTTALNSGRNLTTLEGQCPNLNEVGRYKENQSDGRGKYSGHSARVGSYRPNNWGIYDMHGNQDEWCLDWKTDYPISEALTDPEGPQSGGDRVLRGGSWDSNASYCRSAFRHSNYCAPYFTGNNRGFRLACVSAVR